MSHANRFTFRRSFVHASNDVSLPALDAAIERQLRLLRLHRLIAKRTSALSLALGDDAPLWAELHHLIELYRTRREHAYYALGFTHGSTGSTIHIP